MLFRSTRLEAGPGGSGLGSQTRGSGLEPLSWHLEEACGEGDVEQAGAPFLEPAFLGKPQGFLPVQDQALHPAWRWRPSWGLGWAFSTLCTCQHPPRPVLSWPVGPKTCEPEAPRPHSSSAQHRALSPPLSARSLRRGAQSPTLAVEGQRQQPEKTGPGVPHPLCPPRPLLGALLHGSPSASTRSRPRLACSPPLLSRRISGS